MNRTLNGALRFALGKLATDDAMKNYSWYQNKKTIRYKTDGFLFY
jgi:hypothetical protein